MAVLAAPPTTSGQRTLRRIEAARELLGLESVEVVNMFPLETYRTTDMTRLGTNPSDWVEARSAMEDYVCGAAAVLLAYGVSEPSGLARTYHREQVAWLRSLIDQEAVPAYQVGDGPRHPSRWHRWTSRAHPGVPFSEGLKRSLLLQTFNSLTC